MMISTICLSFALKKTKTLANGTAPIYLRLTIEGNRIEFTNRRYVNPDRWNASAQKMTGTNEEARCFNHYLKALEQQVYEAVLSNQKINAYLKEIGDICGITKPVHLPYGQTYLRNYCHAI